MPTLSPMERRFPLRLSAVAALVEEEYLAWMGSLSERLGEPAAIRVWRTAFRAYDVASLEGILSSGWLSADGGRGAGAGTQDRAPDIHGPVRITATQAIPTRRVGEVISAPPLPQLRSMLASGDVTRESLASEAIHIMKHGVALLCETVIDLYGKQGEFLAYDTLAAIRAARAGSPGGTIGEFIRMCDTDPDPPDVHSAGLDAERIRVTETEHVTRVTACEWARYFSERHPRVGYLVACSTDAAGARAFNDRLRLQRTSTLMEGGDCCDFRYYALSDG